ncbi:GH36-type glycosyl hydrolase domain-containing protein [Chlamydiota bacterium]
MQELLETQRETNSQIFQNKYGFFSDSGEEYIITRPDTPRPWVNIISNGRYGFTVSQTGGGFSWLDNPNVNRITRWRQDLIMDDWGKYVYIRDNNDDVFWSLTWKPCCTELDGYRCTHGFGYSTFQGEFHGINTTKTMFVPLEDNCEIWIVKIENVTDKYRSISLFTFFEWLLGRWTDSHREFHKLFLETEFDPEIMGIKARKTFWEIKNEDGEYWNSDYPYTGFHVSSISPTGFDCDKEKFIGMYGHLGAPRIVRKGTAENTPGKWHDSVGSLHVSCELEPLGSKEICFIIGVEKNDSDIKKTIRKYLEPEKAKKALDSVKKYWRDLTSKVQIKTPDHSMNILCNSWLKYQTISSRLWSKCGYYQSSGAIGFRDQLQDSQLFLAFEPELTKKQILLHARHQFTDGTVYHYWDPITEEGEKSDFSDDLLWLPYVIINYLKETADFSLLKTSEPYLDGKDESLYDHCKKAISKSLERFSKRGLPLIGEGDWNDGLSSCGDKWKGESVWLGHFLYGILREFIHFAEVMNDVPFKKILTSRSADLFERINSIGWDGKWYWRASLDNGDILGTAHAKEARIFLNAQTWALINNTATDQRALQVKQSMEKHLLKEFGPLLFYPGISKPDKNIGYISRYAAGMRENGGLYMHAAVWAIWAECIAKDGQKAYEIYNKICPIKRSLNPEKYKCEPYVTPGNVDGPESLNYGRGGWTWYTGSASWLFRICTSNLLGVSPDYSGLKIDPCIPKDWDSFEIIRPFRGSRYHITVENPHHVSCGVKTVILDDKILEDTVIKPHNDGKTHSVTVILG